MYMTRVIASKKPSLLFHLSISLSSSQLINFICWFCQSLMWWKEEAQLVSYTTGTLRSNYTAEYHITFIRLVYPDSKENDTYTRNNSVYRVCNLIGKDVHTSDISIHASDKNKLCRCADLCSIVLTVWSLQINLFLFDIFIAISCFENFANK